jgi:NAD(P)-dependent dehydrogenase (short-subunit alcohol dehydrogenase family)
MNFAEKTVLITGASRGIGLGIARGFAAAGARLILLADDEAVLTAAETLGGTGLIADITDAGAIAAIAERLPTIDVLINNAGLERLTPIEDTTEAALATFRRIIDINITGTYIVTRAILKNMQPGGRIISTSSVWGRVGEPLFGAYVASKHAIIGLTKTWAKELGPRGINVNAVAPGWVRTESALRSLNIMAERRAMHPDDLLGEILAAQALPGLMDPDDMAGVYMFLASPFAQNVTGQTIGADRGEVPF